MYCRRLMLKRLFSSASEAAVADEPKLRLPPLPTVKEILRIYQLRAIKELSQNFLYDQGVMNKIVNAAGRVKGHHILEVGPGPGGITRSILQKNAANCIVVEKDRRFLPSLELLANASRNKVQIILGDILQQRLDGLFPAELTMPWEGQLPKIKVIGNLPFSVSTPLIIRWLHDMSARRGLWNYGRVRLALTFQKEVAERMVAQIATSQRCRLSVMCQHLCKVEHECTIPGWMCIPKPEVDIGVVRLTPLIEPLIKQPFPLVEKVMRNVFHFRQKFCVKGISVLFPKSHQHLATQMVNMADIDPETKPFQLDMDELRRLCDAYAEICKMHPALIKFEYRDKRSVALTEELMTKEEVAPAVVISEEFAATEDVVYSEMSKDFK